MANKKANSFFEELIKSDFYTSSIDKTASENTDVDKETTKSMLESFSTEQIEALAQELELVSMEKESDDKTLEDMITSETEKEAATEGAPPARDIIEEAKDTPKERTQKDAEEEKNKANKQKESAVDNTNPGKTTNEQSAPSKDVIEEAKDTPKERTQKDSDEDKEKLNKQKEDAVNNTGDAKTADEDSDGEEKEADEDEAVLDAIYKTAEEDLKSEGLGTFDYVSSKISNEEISEFITDKAEKLAFVVDKSPLQVADDIIANIYNILGEE